MLEHFLASIGSSHPIGNSIGSLLILIFYVWLSVTVILGVSIFIRDFLITIVEDVAALWRMVRHGKQGSTQLAMLPYAIAFWISMGVGTYIWLAVL